MGLDNYSKMWYDEVEALPPGSTVLIAIDMEPGLWGSYGATSIAVLNHLIDKEVRFIQVCFYRADNAVVFEQMVIPRVARMSELEYGVDWVNLGYIEGRLTAITQVAQDFSYGVKDYYGNLLEDLPLLDEVKTADDISLIIGVTGLHSDLVRLIGVPYEIHAVITATGMSIAEFLTWMDAGMVHGILVESVGAAQYEYLLKKPGMAIAMVDAINSIHIFMFALVIVTNIAFLIKRSQGEEE
jgi:hypothetical protein